MYPFMVHAIFYWTAVFWKARWPTNGNGRLWGVEVKEELDIERDIVSLHASQIFCNEHAFVDYL